MRESTQRSGVADSRWSPERIQSPVASLGLSERYKSRGVPASSHFFTLHSRQTESSMSPEGRTMGSSHGGVSKGKLKNPGNSGEVPTKGVPMVVGSPGVPRKPRN